MATKKAKIDNMSITNTVSEATLSTQAAQLAESTKVISSLQAELNSVYLALDTKNSIINEYSTLRSSISTEVLRLFPSGGFKAKLVWVIANWKSIIKLIEFIYKKIKEVHEKVDEIKAIGEMNQWSLTAAKNN